MVATEWEDYDEYGPRCYGVPAGDALFRLYNGFAASHKKANRISFNDRLDILRHFLEASDGGKSSKSKVRTPRYRRRLNVDDFPAYPLYCGGRRRASQIQDKLKEEFPNPLPSSKPVVLNGKEKERLQTIFEWSGFDEKAEDLTPRLAPVHRVVKGSREEKENLLNSIVQEIDERETFLRDMKKLGKQDLYKGQMLFEMKDRVKQLKQLDQLLSEEDASLLGRGDQQPKS